MVVTRSPLISSKAVNQLERRPAARCMAHLTPPRTEEGGRTKRSTIFGQSRRHSEQCKICKAGKLSQGRHCDSRKQQTSHSNPEHKSRAPRQQETLSTARPVMPKKDNRRRDSGGARSDYPREMESTLQNLSLDDIKEEEMMIGQVDGLVDYSSSEDDASDKSSTGEPHIWEVPDSKTWVLSQ